MSAHIPPSEPDPSTTLQPRRPPLTTDEQGKLDTLLRHLNAPTLSLPQTVKDVKAAQKQRVKSGRELDKWIGTPLDQGGQIKGCTPLSDREKCYLTSEQCQRFLRAVKWDVLAAFSRTEETVVWRREFQVDDLAEDSAVVSEEGETGKELVMGYDIFRRPCLYMHPARQNTKTSPKQIQHVVWVLERTVDLMPAGVENLCLLIDMGSVQPAPVGQSRKVLEILQTYYCERLGRAICINIPSVFNYIYKLLGPFIDPVTKDKIQFNPDVRTLVPPSQLEKANFKGDYDFTYNHDEYMAWVTETTRRAREERFARWEKIGEGKCGTSEYAIKGGLEASGASSTEPATTTANGAGKQGTGSIAAGSTGDESGAGLSGAAPAGSSGSVLQSTSVSQSNGNGEASQAIDGASRTEATTNAPSGSLQSSTADETIRPRQDSMDSFVTTNEGPPSTVTALKHARDDTPSQADIAESDLPPAPAPAPAHDGLNLGVAGLVIKEDGSIGMPSVRQ